MKTIRGMMPHSQNWSLTVSNWSSRSSTADSFERAGRLVAWTGRAAGVLAAGSGSRRPADRNGAEQDKASETGSRDRIVTEAVLERDSDAPAAKR